MKKVFYFTLLVCFGISGGAAYAQGEQPDNNKLLELYQAQRYREAAAYLRSFYSDTTADPAVLNRLGYCYRMAGDYGQAEPYYQRLYTLDSLNVFTLMNLAAVQMKRGLYASAAVNYQRNLSVDGSEEHT